MDKEHLTKKQRKVTQKGATESAFSGEYWDCEKDGTYMCVVCNESLFSSDTKFNSGTGWPSFTNEIEENKTKRNIDTKYGMKRQEVVCTKCDAHLGHVFDDGTTSTGERFCINSASLKLEEGEQNTCSEE